MLAQSIPSRRKGNVAVFRACLGCRRNFWVTTMRVCYRVSCDPVLTKLLVKLSVCWPGRACVELSKQFRCRRGWMRPGAETYPSLILLLSDLYLINTYPSEKNPNTISVWNAHVRGQVESTLLYWKQINLFLNCELGLKYIFCNRYDDIKCKGATFSEVRLLGERDYGGVSEGHMHLLCFPHPCLCSNTVML